MWSALGWRVNPVCGLSADSTAYCDFSASNAPRMNLGKGWTAIISAGTAGGGGPRAVCALSVSGQPSCWDERMRVSFSQLVAVPGAPPLVFLNAAGQDGAGYGRMCGLTAGGELYCIAYDDTRSTF